MKNPTSTLIVVAAFTLTMAGSVRGQVCTGGPALGSNASGNVGGGVSFFDGGKQYGAGATFGRALFLSGGFSYSDFDDTSLSLKSLSAGVGYEIARPESPVSVCPGISVGYGFGLEIFGIDVTTTSVAPSVALGIEAEVSETVTVIPFAQGAVLFQRLRADAGPLGEETESETDAVLTLGVAFVFNGRLGLAPVVYIPIASDGGDTRFGVGLSVAVGGSR